VISGNFFLPLALETMVGFASSLLFSVVLSSKTANSDDFEVVASPVYAEALAVTAEAVQAVTESRVVFDLAEIKNFNVFLRELSDIPKETEIVYLLFNSESKSVSRAFEFRRQSVLVLTESMVGMPRTVPYNVDFIPEVEITSLDALQAIFEETTADSPITMYFLPSTPTSQSLFLFTNFPNFGPKLQIKFEMPAHLNFMKNLPTKKISLEISSCKRSNFSGLALVKSTLEELVVIFDPRIDTSCENIRHFEQADLSVIAELGNLKNLTIADQSSLYDPITGTSVILPPVFPMKDGGYVNLIHVKATNMMQIPSALIQGNFTESSYDAFELTGIKMYTVALNEHGDYLIPRMPNLASMIFAEPIASYRSYDLKDRLFAKHANFGKLKFIRFDFINDYLLGNGFFQFLVNLTKLRVCVFKTYRYISMTGDFASIFTCTARNVNGGYEYDCQKLSRK
jgi:hypothetical protein